MKTEEESKIEAMLKYLKDKGVIKSWYYNGTYHAELKQTEQAEIVELKADNDARKFAMAMSEKVEKQLREQIEKMKCCGNCKHCKYSESEESYEWCEKHDQIVNIAIKPCYAYEMFDLDKAIKEIEK